MNENAKLSDIVDTHRTACEMAAKTRSLPQLVEWFASEYSDEVRDAWLAHEVLSPALLQFYPKTK